MSKRTRNILIALAALLLLAVAIYQIPRVKAAVAWRVEKFTIYAKNTINPPGPVPTALPVTPQPATPTIIQTPTLVADIEPTAAGIRPVVAGADLWCYSRYSTAPVILFPAL